MGSSIKGHINGRMGFKDLSNQKGTTHDYHLELIGKTMSILLFPSMVTKTIQLPGNRSSRGDTKIFYQTNRWNGGTGLCPTSGKTSHVQHPKKILYIYKIKEGLVPNVSDKYRLYFT